MTNHSTTTTDAFAQKAGTWENPAKLLMSETFVERIKSLHVFSAETILMDVGCGTGLVGLSFVSQVDQLLFVDTSAAMLGVLKMKLAQCPEDSSMHKKQQAGKITMYHSALESVPKAVQAHAMVTLLALHHIEDTRLFFAEAFERLYSGGRLIVGDLYAEDGSFHAPETVPHNGFDSRKLKTELEGIGFQSIHIEPLMSVEKKGQTYPLFILTARK